MKRSQNESEVQPAEAGAYAAFLLKEVSKTKFETHCERFNLSRDMSRGYYIPQFRNITDLERFAEAMPDRWLCVDFSRLILKDIEFVDANVIPSPWGRQRYVVASKGLKRLPKAEMPTLFHDIVAEKSFEMIISLGSPPAFYPQSQDTPSANSRHDLTLITNTNVELEYRVLELHAHRLADKSRGEAKSISWTKRHYALGADDLFGFASIRGAFSLAQKAAASTKPVLVMCDAGCFESCAFLALVLICECLSARRHFSVSEIARHVLEHRRGYITEELYVWIHRALDYGMRKYGFDAVNNGERLRERLNREYTRWHEALVESRKNVVKPPATSADAKVDQKLPKWGVDISKGAVNIYNDDFCLNLGKTLSRNKVDYVVVALGRRSYNEYLRILDLHANEVKREEEWCGYPSFTFQYSICGKKRQVHLLFWQEWKGAAPIVELFRKVRRSSVLLNVDGKRETPMSLTLAAILYALADLRASIFWNAKALLQQLACIAPQFQFNVSTCDWVTYLVFYELARHYPLNVQDDMNAWVKNSNFKFSDGKPMAPE